MKRKILSIFLIMALSLTLLTLPALGAQTGSPSPTWIGTDGTEHFYIQNHTDAELEIIMARIANGENVVFGDGIPLDNTSPNSRWTSKTNETHQWITARAFVILSNEKLAAYNFYTTWERAQIIEASDWPDKHEDAGFGDFLINDKHFYIPATGKSYYGKNETAKTRFEAWYGSSLANFKTNILAKRLPACLDLGKAIHYLSDVSSPPHTGDTGKVGFTPDPVKGERHFSFENRANAIKANHAVSDQGNYTFFQATLVTGIIHPIANYAFGYYHYVEDGTYNSYDAAASVMLKKAQRDVAGLLYKTYISN